MRRSHGYPCCLPVPLTHTASGRPGPRSTTALRWAGRPYVSSHDLLGCHGERSRSHKYKYSNLPTHCLTLASQLTNARCRVSEQCCSGAHPRACLCTGHAARAAAARARTYTCQDVARIALAVRRATRVRSLPPRGRCGLHSDPPGAGHCGLPPHLPPVRPEGLIPTFPHARCELETRAATTPKTSR